MMKKVKNLLLGVLIFNLFFISCSGEDEPIKDRTDGEKARLSFNLILGDLMNSKVGTRQAAADIPLCAEDVPFYVNIMLSNDEGLVVGSEGAPFRIDLAAGQNFTRDVPELQLDPGRYSLEHCAVYNEAGTLIWIAPKGGVMADYVDNPLPLMMDLGPGVNRYLDVPVLCFDDRMVNEYGYLFFDLEGVEAIEFCTFGNLCDDSGRHFPAHFSMDIWYFENGQRGRQLYSDVENEVDIDENEDFAGTTVCMALPDSAGPDQYYIEISILNSEAYGEVTEEIIRSGVISDEDIRDLLDGDTAVDFYHFRQGGCNLEDSPDIFDEGEGNNETTDSDNGEL